MVGAAVQQRVDPRGGYLLVAHQLGPPALQARQLDLRLQDVLPDITGLWLRPAEMPAPYNTPFARFPVPDGTFLHQASEWRPTVSFGKAYGSTAALDTSGEAPAIRFSTTFEGTGDDPLLVADRVRLTYPCEVDLEPFGQLSFTFEGGGSGHVAALRLVDAKGDEKLLWQARDSEAGRTEVTVPVSFEGNDVFDPGHVVGVCLDLDAGNVAAGPFSGAIVGVGSDVGHLRVGDVVAVNPNTPCRRCSFCRRSVTSLSMAMKLTSRPEASRIGCTSMAIQ